MPSKAKSVQNNDPITLIMQWLTYVFWGGLSICLLWLSIVVLAYFIVGAGTNDNWGTLIAYPIAAVIVLYVAAAVFDVFYRRREPVHKAGFASAIMVIHTVIFAMCAVAAFITALFITINLLISPLESDQDYKYVVLGASLVQLVAFAVLLVRTAMVHKVTKASSYTMVGLGVLVALFIAAGVAGPLAKSVTSKQDTLLTRALRDANSNIGTYASRNGKLPAKLDEVAKNFKQDNFSYINSDAIKYALDHDLVTYKPNTLPSEFVRDDLIVFYYQLCAQFDKDTTGDSTDSLATESNNLAKADYKRDYLIDFGRHAKGEQCYNVKVEAYQYDYK